MYYIHNAFGRCGARGGRSVQCGGADRAVLPDMLEAHESLRTKSKFK